MVKSQLAVVIRALWFEPDIDGLVCVADLNGKTLDLAAGRASRLDHLVEIASNTLAELDPSARLTPLKVALGLAVPCLEAWLVTDGEPEQSESLWAELKSRGARSPDYNGDLKRRAHGARRSRRRSEEKSTRLGELAAARAGELERLFPIGFGSLARSLRQWPPGAGPALEGR